MWDLHNNVKVIRVIPPVAVGTTGTGQTGSIIDRAGFEEVEFGIHYGAITATDATFTVTVLEGDATGSMTSVADADLLGTESNAGIPQAATRTDNSNENVSKRLGYKGIKRYVQVNVSSTITAATPICVDAMLSRPAHAPVAT